MSGGFPISESYERFAEAEAVLAAFDGDYSDPDFVHHQARCRAAYDALCWDLQGATGLSPQRIAEIIIP